MSPATLAMRLIVRPSPRRRAQMAVLTVLLLGGIMVLDVFGRPEVRTPALNIIPVAVAAWFVPPMMAVLVAVATVGGWLGLDLSTPGAADRPAVHFVNAGIRLVVYLALVGLMASVRSTLALFAELAGKDPLTGLHNRRGFREQADVEFERARRHGRPLTLASLDLDGFKRINDTRGHASGDDLLRVAGGLFRSELRTGDLAARLGGDEFAILLPETAPDEAVATLEAIRRRFEQRVGADGWDVTASIGAVTLHPVRHTVDEALILTDRAMYAVKQNGKNSLHHEVVSGATPDQGASRR